MRLGPAALIGVLASTTTTIVEGFIIPLSSPQTTTHWMTRTFPNSYENPSSTTKLHSTIDAVPTVEEDDTLSSWDFEDVDDVVPQSSEEEVMAMIPETEGVERLLPTHDPRIVRAWQFLRKQLLSIGSKGAGPTHGNSLRELLASHTAIKIKINTQKYGSLEESADALIKLAEEAGAPKGIQLLHARASDNTIMLGMPGTMQKIADGLYPPPGAKPPKSRKEKKAATEWYEMTHQNKKKKKKKKRSSKSSIQKKPKLP